MGIAEMPSTWPTEALKAQAIAARTYAYRYKVQEPPFVLMRDVRSSQAQKRIIHLMPGNKQYKLHVGK